MKFQNDIEDVFNEFKGLRDGLSRHVKISTDVWFLTGWKKDQVQFDGRRIIDQHEKLLREIIDCEARPGKTALPTYIQVKRNVITLSGLTQGIKQGWPGTDHADTPFDWNSVGTTGTAEDEAQTDLLAEDSGAPYARKQFSVSGQARVVNQTGKLGMIWDDGDVSANPITLKESGVHWHASDASKCYARVAFADFILDVGDLFVVQINELNANGVL